MLTLGLSIASMVYSDSGNALDIVNLDSYERNGDSRLNFSKPFWKVFWLPPRDSNPDMLLQRQLSYH